jgi:apolipoprotein N-acyltransferase
VALPSLAVVAVAALGLFGVLRLSQSPTIFDPDVTVRIMQPALDQLQKWDPANRDEVLSTYYRLSAPEGSPLVENTVLVWPESAFPFALTQDPGALAAIAELLPERTALVTGAYREEYTPDGERQVYNTIYAIDQDGTILSAYDKVHLVPIGEYMPGSDLLNRYGVEQLAPLPFTAGPFRRAIALPFAPPFIPLICYEIIFPGEVVEESERPAFLLNVTNDGWFGRTSGPYQHFHQARVRSVEEGLPLVRAANTGISAIIDAYGRNIAVAPLGETTMIEARLPAPISVPFYARWRTLVFLLSVAVCMLVGATKILYRASAV